MKNNESNHGKLCCLKYIGKDRGGKYIRMCFDAIRQLRDSKYLIGSEAEKDFIYERNLMISLAYLLGKNNSNSIRPCYLIGGEVCKFIFDKAMMKADDDVNNNWIKETKEKLHFSSLYVSPDFLIHRYKKFEDIHKGGQKLIVEAKSKANIDLNEFKKDLFKLNVYLNRLQFERSLYILVNSTVNEIDSKIGQYIEKDLYWSENIKKKLYFLIQEKEESCPKLYMLREDLHKKIKDLRKYHGHCERFLKEFPNAFSGKKGNGERIIKIVNKKKNKRKTEDVVLT